MSVCDINLLLKRCCGTLGIFTRLLVPISHEQQKQHQHTHLVYVCVCVCVCKSLWCCHYKMFYSNAQRCFVTRTVLILLKWSLGVCLESDELVRWVLAECGDVDHIHIHQELVL